MIVQLNLDIETLSRAELIELASQADVQIVDPAYSGHVHANAVSNGTAGAGLVDRDLGFEPLTEGEREALAIAAAHVKRWTVLFSDHEGTHLWREVMAEACVEYLRLVPWIRWSQPQMSGDRPGSQSEAVLHFHAQHVGPRGGTKPMAKHWSGPGSLTHYARRCLRGADKHPAEKPLDLMLDHVSWFSDPGECVLDLKCGSGTTGLACTLLGRDAILNDEAPAWAAYSEARASLTEALSTRDRDRALEWVASTREEASRVPEPSAPDGSDVKTWERAQRRLADADRVVRAVNRGKP